MNGVLMMESWEDQIENTAEIARFKIGFIGRLKDNMKQRNLTQRDVADRVNMTPASVNGHFMAPKKVSENFIRRISLAYSWARGEYAAYRRVADAAFIARGEAQPEWADDVEQKVWDAVEIIKRQADGILRLILEESRQARFPRHPSRGHYGDTDE